MQRGLGRQGFTLIELLVVIVIIGILIAATLAVGGRVIAGGKVRLTSDLIRQSDIAVETFITDVGGNPRPLVEAPNPDPMSSDLILLPMVDGVDLSAGNDNRRFVNSMGLFIHAAERQGLTSLFDGVPSDFLVRYDGDAFVDTDRQVLGFPDNQPELRTVVDAWGKPLRFVHPAFDGLITEEYLSGSSRSIGSFGNEVTTIDDGSLSVNDYVLDASRLPRGYGYADVQITEIRRNRLWRRAPGETDPDPDDYEALDASGVPAIGDSDGGRCVNDRPYVYSAGEDGDPSTYADPSRDLDGDNVYGDIRPRYSTDRP